MKLLANTFVTDIVTRILSILLLTPFTFAEVNISTLSGWDIDDYGENALSVSKITGETIFLFYVFRPHCISELPTLMMSSEMGAFSDGDKVHAEIRLDKVKFQSLKLKRLFAFENNGKEINTFKMLNFPALDQSQLIEVRFKSQTPLKGFSLTTTGIEKAMYQVEQICNSSHVIKEVSEDRA